MSGRRYSRDRIATASITGLALAHIQVRRLDRDQALAEIAAILNTVPPERRQDVIDEAAATYINPDPASASWYPRVVELLEAAGANRDHAHTIADQRQQQGSFVIRESRNVDPPTP